MKYKIFKKQEGPKTYFTKLDGISFNTIKEGKEYLKKMKEYYKENGIMFELTEQFMGPYFVMKNITFRYGKLNKSLSMMSECKKFEITLSIK